LLLADPTQGMNCTGTPTWFAAVRMFTCIPLSLGVYLHSSTCSYRDGPLYSDANCTQRLVSAVSETESETEAETETETETETGSCAWCLLLLLSRRVQETEAAPLCDGLGALDLCCMQYSGEAYELYSCNFTKTAGEAQWAIFPVR
jgi:hypothetical protein